MEGLEVIAAVRVGYVASWMDSELVCRCLCWKMRDCRSLCKHSYPVFDRRKSFARGGLWVLRWDGLVFTVLVSDIKA